MFFNLVALVVFCAILFALTKSFVPKIPSILSAMFSLFFPRQSRQAKAPIKRKTYSEMASPNSGDLSLVNQERKVLWSKPIDYSEFETPSYLRKTRLRGVPAIL